MKRRGLTLLELVIALAILAIVATLALPSFGAGAERTRLRLAAETLASDLAEARFEAAKAGRALHLPAQAGPAWCWAVATTPDCGCAAAAPCQLKAERAASHAGVTLVEVRAASFDPGGAATGGGALLRSGRGEELRVELSPLGRPRVCAPGGAVVGYPAC
jgi:type IV fimbrial biogenesis protein FimT